MSRSRRCPRSKTRNSNRQKAGPTLAYEPLESRILLAADIAERNVVVNGGFEQVETAGVIQGAYDDSLVEGWTAKNSSLGQRLSLLTIDSERGTVLQIDSTDELFDIITQDIETDEAEYMLAFDARTRPVDADADPLTNDLEVYWGGVSQGRFTAVDHWQTITIQLMGDGRLTELLFCEVPEPNASLGDGRGPLIDNVRLVKVSDSVVENGSFELAVKGEGDLFTSRNVAGWAAMGPTTERRIQIVDTTDASDGNRVLSLDWSAASLDRVYQDVATQANATYFLSFEMRSSSGQPDVANDLRVRWSDEWAGTFRGDADWQSFGVVVTADSDLSRLVFREASLNGGSSTGEGPQIDNVQLYRLDTIASDLIVDLNGVAAGNNSAAMFNESSGPQAITSGQIVISNNNGSRLSSATVRIQNPLESDSDGTSVEVLSATTDGTRIRATYNSDLGILRLVGEDTLAHYQSVLSKLQYDNTSKDPDDTMRTVSVSVIDRGVTSMASIVELSINTLDDAPEFNTVIDEAQANIGQLFTRRLDATDPEGTTVNYSLEFTGDSFIAGGASPTISESGIFQWLPDRQGTLNVRVTATDANGNSNSFSFDITSTFVPPSGQVPGDFVPFSGQRQLSNTNPAFRNGIYDSAPSMTIDTLLTYEAVIRTASGDMRYRLLASQSPITVNNFVNLAEDGFFDGLTFHRVIPGFVAQGGDPLGTGAGGPGYQFVDELNNGLEFDAVGQLAMANSGPNTNGSQFFVTFTSDPNFAGQHTIFGELISGGDVLNGLTPRNPGDGFAGDVIQRVIIEVV